MHSESIQKRNRTVLKHLGLARHVSRQEARKGPESYEDLHQEAALGLIRGVDQFDPTLGFRPSSYLVRRCRGQVLHYRRDRAKTIRIPWIFKQLSDNQSSRPSDWGVSIEYRQCFWYGCLL